MSWNSSRWKEKAFEGIAKALCMVFDLEWDSDEALKFIRKAYQQNITPPKASRRENVVYIHMSLVQDAPTDWAATSYGADGQAVLTKTLPLSILLTFYGDDCEEMSEYARTRLLADTGYPCPRAILRDYNMVPVLPFSSPIPVHEPDEGEWRLRSDLRIRLNLLHQDTYQYQAVESIPDLTIEPEPIMLPLVVGEDLNLYGVQCTALDETLIINRRILYADEISVLGETLTCERPT